MQQNKLVVLEMFLSLILKFVMEGQMLQFKWTFNDQWKHILMETCIYSGNYSLQCWLWYDIKWCVC